MTRPQMVRADTLDLQDTDSPSAKDHSRQPTSPGAIGEGPPAPHQASALKSAGLDGIELRSRSPRASQDLSGKEIQLLQSHDEGEEPRETSLLDEITTGSQDGELDSEGEESLDDDMMDKISSSPSIDDDEDIDFESVYALHTFVATVEGQANATKGDTMILLDDSNSYWWLVRIVKDSSIGYLPAEHIETPTERLARLNKHRNIDLSQTMLSDNTERVRSNPLRKARKRRNAKTVQFTEPTYYEPSEHEYSSDEDGSPDDMEFITTADAANGASETEPAKEEITSASGVDNTASVAAAEPARPQDAPRENGHLERSAMETTAAVAPAVVAAEALKSPDSITTMNSETADDPSAAKKTRIRNTDSFYKDDSIETRRINLTPSLLREDNPQPAETQQNNRNRSSSESTIKSTNSDKPVEKRKEKKSVLGRLFKAKNSKKVQAEEEHEEWIAKDLTDKSSSRSSADVSSMDTGSTTTVSTKGSPARTGSKLQKAPPPQKSNSFNKGTAKAPVLAPLNEPAVSAPQLEAAPAISPITNPFAEETDIPIQQNQPQDTGSWTTITSPADTTRSPTESKNRNLFAPIRDVLTKTESPTEPKVERVKKAPSREPIEDSDDSEMDLGQSRGVNGSEQHTKNASVEQAGHIAPLNSATHDLSYGNDAIRNNAPASLVRSISSTPELIERPSQEMGASTAESSAGSSKRENFNWSRCKKWFDEEFNDWYVCLMDVSDEMKGFDWKTHWAYKEYCQDVIEQQEDVVEELDWSLVDYYDIEKRYQQGLPQSHPQYRQIGWEKQWMRYEQDCQRKGTDPEWLPWKDPEYAYLYPHRPKPAGAAAGPPAGCIGRPQHELKIIGPAALHMKLPPLDSDVSKGFSPYPRPPVPADIEQRLQAELHDVSKS